MIRFQKLITLWLALAMASCGGGEEKPESTENKKEEKKQVIDLGKADWVSQIGYRVMFNEPDDFGNLNHKIDSFQQETGSQTINQLMKLVYDGVMDSTITAYPVDILGEPDFEAPLTINALKKLLFRKDTVYTENIETGELDMTEVEVNLTADQFSALVFEQQWAHQSDTEPFMVTNDLIGFCSAKYDEATGALRGIKPVFYVRLKNEKEKEEKLAWNRKMAVVAISDSLGNMTFTGLEHYYDEADPVSTPIKERLFEWSQIGTGNDQELIATYLQQKWSYYKNHNYLMIEPIKYGLSNDSLGREFLWPAEKKPI